MTSLSGRKQQARSDAERSISYEAEIIALKRKAASWGANETEESITSLTGRWEALANWFSTSVMRQGVSYPSVEHAFQAAKATDPEAADEIRKAKSPKEAHALGNKLALPKDWERRRVPRGMRLAGKEEDAIICPIDVHASTPRVPWRTRNVTIEPHTPHAVTVQQVLASPRVRLLHNFITADEAAEILRLSKPLFGRSPVRSVATDRRTSSTATLGFGTFNAAISSVRARIAAFSGYEDHMLEPLQVVRYHPGEKYEPHHDLFDLCDFPQKPRRHLTFLIYLNDMPDESGGHTTFPRLNLRIRPRMGTALVFNDVLDSGMDDERTEHSGTPPSSGVKYAINCWIRARDPSPRGSLFGMM